METVICSHSKEDQWHTHINWSVKEFMPIIYCKKCGAFKDSRQEFKQGKTHPTYTYSKWKS